MKNREHIILLHAHILKRYHTAHCTPLQPVRKHFSLHFGKILSKNAETNMFNSVMCDLHTRVQTTNTVKFEFRVKSGYSEPIRIYTVKRGQSGFGINLPHHINARERPDWYAFIFMHFVVQTTSKNQLRPSMPPF
jgi:hypothetical protein